LTPALAEACADLHQLSFLHGWSALEFERLIGAAASFGDMACYGKASILGGFILSRGAAGEAEILTIAVAPACRRRGVGRGLVERHLARLAAARIETLFLEVSETNTAARKLYAACGFVEVGRRPAYYAAAPGEAPAAALILRRTIG
jgi:ribosomal-protein-alanine N-acetyltransferase